MKIRFIVDIIKSKHDVNGNSYYITQITSTKTGKSQWTETPHGSNITGEVTDFVHYTALHITDQTLPIREFKSLRLRTNATYNYGISIIQLKELERE